MKNLDSERPELCAVEPLKTSCITVEAYIKTSQILAKNLKSKTQANGLEKK